MQLDSNPLFHILHIGKLIERELDANVTQNCDMSHSDAKLLIVIGWTDGPTQQYLADAMQVSAPAISRQIDKLVKEGFISRKVNPTNRRSSSVVLTTKGIKKHDQTKDFLQNTLDGLLLSCKGINQDTKESLVRILHNLEQTIKAPKITPLKSVKKNNK